MSESNSKYAPRERRGYPRWPIVVEVDISSSHTFYAEQERFFTEDLSVGGIFVAAKCPQPKGTHLQFQFTLPDNDRPITATGEVQWRREQGTSDSGETEAAGMGIRFIDLSTEDLERIRRFIRNERGTINQPLPKLDE